MEGVEIRPLTPSEEQVERERVEEEAATSLKFVLWVLIALALAAVAMHYAFPGTYMRRNSQAESNPAISYRRGMGRQFSIQRNTHED